MDWLPTGTFDKGVVGGLVVGMSWFLLVCFFRSAVHIHRNGLWCWFKSGLKVEHDSLGLFLVLLILLLAVVLLFRVQLPWM
jgi:hypothetical protein